MSTRAPSPSRGDVAPERDRGRRDRAARRAAARRSRRAAALRRRGSARSPRSSTRARGAPPSRARATQVRGGGPPGDHELAGRVPGDCAGRAQPRGRRRRRAASGRGQGRRTAGAPASSTGRAASRCPPPAAASRAGRGPVARDLGRASAAARCRTARSGQAREDLRGQAIATTSAEKRLFASAPGVVGRRGRHERRRSAAVASGIAPDAEDDQAAAGAQLAHELGGAAPRTARRPRIAGGRPTSPPRPPRTRPGGARRAPPAPGQPALERARPPARARVRG